ncbi:protein translocase subunit SecA [Anopheles sinensis]|uniref:Protein translocase subunit SecA n=1 Tax=Anopheles sinensis TaxID=74873 RepID=A0A084VMY5_ANOSI|nr:protein translocase subunit SecA [Anopheles sinensis]
MGKIVPIERASVRNGIIRTRIENDPPVACGTREPRDWVVIITYDYRAFFQAFSFLPGPGIYERARTAKVGRPNSAPGSSVQPAAST